MQATCSGRSVRSEGSGNQPRQKHCEYSNHAEDGTPERLACDCLTCHRPRGRPSTFRPIRVPSVELLSVSSNSRICCFKISSFLGSDSSAILRQSAVKASFMPVVTSLRLQNKTRFAVYVRRCISVSDSSEPGTRRGGLPKTSLCRTPDMPEAPTTESGAWRGGVGRVFGRAIGGDVGLLEAPRFRRLLRLLVSLHFHESRRSGSGRR